MQRSQPPILASDQPTHQLDSAVVSQSTVAVWAVINRDDKFFDVGPLCGDGQRLDVAGTIEQLVLERQVTRQRLLERFGLLGQGFDRCSGAAQDRSQDVGEAPWPRIAVSTPRSLYLGDGLALGVCPRNSPVGWSDKTSTSTSPTQAAAPP